MMEVLTDCSYLLMKNKLHSVVLKQQLMNHDSSHAEENDLMPRTLFKKAIWIVQKDKIAMFFLGGLNNQSLH